MKCFQIIGLSALVATVSGASVQLDKRATPLDVKIEMVGNSLVKATVTNSGDATLKLLKTGSILGEHVVEKTEIFTGGMSGPKPPGISPVHPLILAVCGYYRLQGRL